MLIVTSRNWLLSLCLEKIFTNKVSYIKNPLPYLVTTSFIVQSEAGSFSLLGRGVSVGCSSDLQKHGILVFWINDWVLWTFSNIKRIIDTCQMVSAFKFRTLIELGFEALEFGNGGL
ncbi:hypothetical protein RCL_jg16279.t1 [Rhizophagus clarus]|uniref:Uncharacterized protein n=1 Tax=Rhizophagus clarus TaxID=94130 RepID=A0A8H3QZL8_9GLOM|nr:hypothetical protein RCL_jg16279.t1 [Rhizophagus clarus]